MRVSCLVPLLAAFCPTFKRNFCHSCSCLQLRICFSTIQGGWCATLISPHLCFCKIEADFHLPAFLTNMHCFCSPCVLSSWESLEKMVWLGWPNRLCGTQLPECLWVQHLMSEAVFLHCVCVGWELLRAASTEERWFQSCWVIRMAILDYILMAVDISYAEHIDYSLGQYDLILNRFWKVQILEYLLSFATHFLYC